MVDVMSLTMRELQRECARALAVWKPTNNELSPFNKMAHHDSQGFYRSVVQKYVDEHGGLPSMVGPGRDIVLIHSE